MIKELFTFPPEMGKEKFPDADQECTECGLDLENDCKCEND